MIQTRSQDEPELPNLFNKMTSNGFIRGKLHVISNESGSSSAPSNHGALALANDEDEQIKATSQLQADTQEGMIVQVGVSVHHKAEDQKREQVREAKAKGYEGDACMECGMFTLLRNGTCLKCDTCGGTSGCS